MRALTLDTTSFTPNLVNLLRLLPNNISNSVWEAVPNSHAKPVPQAPYEDRLKYITAKYFDGATPIDAKTLPAEANSLSDAAKRYLQAKSDRVQQNLQSPPPQHTTPLKSTTGLGISSNPPASSGVTSLGGDLNRTVSKLQKRLSAGGKTFRIQDRDTEGK